jgi:predicted nucleotidyltransferase
MHPPAHLHDAPRNQAVASLRHTLMLRMVVASGATQREAAAAVGTSQSAVSRRLRRDLTLTSTRPDILLEAAAPVLRSLAEKHGYRRLAVFGSVARSDAHYDSDIDLLVDAPPGTSSFDFLQFKQLIEKVIGRKVDLISHGGLLPGLDDDVLRVALLL